MVGQESRTCSPTTGGRASSPGHDQKWMARGNLPAAATRPTGEKAGALASFAAPRGTERECKGWHQEAALRMLCNNLDPEVAEDPQRLVVYGGSGRAARSHEALKAIVAALLELEDDETLLVQSGKPVGVFRTHPGAPRVLIANSLLPAALALLGELGCDYAQGFVLSPAVPAAELAEACRRAERLTRDAYRPLPTGSR